MLLTRPQVEAICLNVHERIAKEFSLVQCLLFGSYARGDANEWSDIDLYIEVNEISDDIKIRIREIAWELGLDSGVVISTLVVSRHEREETALRSAPIVAAILRDGITV